MDDDETVDQRRTVLKRVLSQSKLPTFDNKRATLDDTKKDDGEDNPKKDEVDDDEEDVLSILSEGSDSKVFRKYLSSMGGIPFFLLYLLCLLLETCTEFFLVILLSLWTGSLSFNIICPADFTNSTQLNTTSSATHSASGFCYIYWSVGAVGTGIVLLIIRLWIWYAGASRASILLHNTMIHNILYSSGNH